MAKFNIIGFGHPWRNKPDRPEYQYCSIHKGTILVKTDQIGFLQCPTCGQRVKDPEYQGEAEALATEIDELIKRNRHIVRK
jgi:hypothetical protein